MLKKCYGKVAKETTAQHLFEYGVLKRDEPKHTFLTDKKNGHSKFVETGETVSKYPLIIFTSSNLPCLIRRSGVGFNVQGEIYEIDDKMLKTVDTFRQHPNFYLRKPELIRCTGLSQENKKTVLIRCWTYFFLLQNTEKFSSDLLQSYSSKGSHGKPFKG